MTAKRIALLALAALLALGLLAGCASSAPATSANTPGTTSAPATGDTFVFTDSCGREVTLPTNLTQVAPSGAAAQIILFTANPDAMVGWSAQPDESQKKYYGEEYWNMPEFGQFYGKNVSLNMEALIAASPQVIIDMGDMKEGHGEDMDAIQEQTGIPTIFIEANLETFPAAYRTLGQLLNCEEQCEKIAAYIEATTAYAEEKAATIADADKVSVYYGTGETGLDANAKGSIHADVIDIIGAENACVVEEISNKGGGNTISMEQLLNFDPDVIIQASAACYQNIATDELWQGLRAVENDAYYEIPTGPYCWMGSPPSVNRIIGIYWLGSLIYPELYSDIDMVQETIDFYELFWHYAMSEEEAREMLANSTLKAAGETIASPEQSATA